MKTLTLFEEQLSRLKMRLGVTKDHEVATALGLGKAALSDRKQRGAFPEQKVREFAGRHPEFNLDIEYVLTGRSQREDAFDATLEKLRVAAKSVEKLDVPDSVKASLRIISGHPTHIDDVLLMQVMTTLARVMQPGITADELETVSRHAGFAALIYNKVAGMESGLRRSAIDEEATQIGAITRLMKTHPGLFEKQDPAASKKSKGK